MERRYGFFRCTSCQKTWESSHVYCRPGTETVMFKQDCKDCNIACFPYKTEPIRCSQCGQTICVCTDEELEDKRHTNLEKPHLASLCHKCRAGIPCQNSY
ncbi:hypothetical protein ACOMHN_029149 [Nucella lapillus]